MPPVEALLSAKITGQPIARDTAAWLAGIGAVFKDKLAAVGLTETTSRVALGEFLKSYVLNRPDVKPATLEVWLQPCRNLTEYFGDDRPLRGITVGDAEQFAQWLRTQNLAATTFAKRLGFARTFFHTARKHTLIEENPFVEVKIPAADVSGRQQFVHRDAVRRLLAAAATWRRPLVPPGGRSATCGRRSRSSSLAPVLSRGRGCSTTSEVRRRRRCWGNSRSTSSHSGWGTTRRSV